MTAPPIQYTRADDGTSIAYWTLGEGPLAVFIPPPGMAHLELK
ncbi:MAG: hypothetical protein DK306_001351 [Chloroflexi bacterium]|nr:MAG: hypothetical protein DK306_001351 [Chloroflexota bacterium]